MGLRMQEMTASVQLIKALGGGWDVSQNTTTAIPCVARLASAGVFISSSKLAGYALRASQFQRSARRIQRHCMNAVHLIAASLPAALRSARHWLFPLGGIGLIPLGLLDNSPFPLPGLMHVATIVLCARQEQLWLSYALMATE